MRKKYLVTFSGGKDSLAIIIWAKLTLKDDEWDVVFCDTGWEAQATYDYIDWIEANIGKKFIRLKSTAFENKIDQHVRESIVRIFGRENVFAEMVMSKKRFPSTRARFCTEFLKMMVMIDYILTLQYDVVVVQGVRAEESASRAMLKKNDEYFKFYFEAKRYNKKKEPVYDTYRKADIVAWLDLYSCDVVRPILDWTAAEVFDSIFANGFRPNPLYFKGHSRVGCYPCIMCQLSEIRLIAQNDPERINQLEEFEKFSGFSFFPPGYIPEKACSRSVFCRVYPEDLPRLIGGKPKKKSKKAAPAGMFPNEEVADPKELLYQRYFKSPNITVHIDEEGDEYIIKKVKVPTIRDVVNYVSTPGQQLLDVAQAGCVSVYNICEVGSSS